MSSERAKLVDELQTASRVAVTRSAAFHHAVAARVGLHATDLNCLNLLALHGPMAVGALAEAAGLTKGGAITAAVDRLEKAGYATRDRDPADRRRLRVRMVSEAATRIAALMPSEPWEEMYARYSDDELALVLEFTERSSAVAQNLIDRLG